MIAAVYARKSTEQTGADADAKSVDRQIDNARAFAAAKGWTVPDGLIYSDDAVSGAETRKLVNRQRLLDAIAAGPTFQAPIVRDASRFSRRDGDEAFGELKRIAQAGVAVWFYQDGTVFEYGNFAANITGIVRAEMNAEFRRQIAKWTREAMVRKAQAGYVTGGRVFGYDNLKVDGHVERRINEPEADVVRRIFRLSADGHGTKAIAKRLNEDRVPSPRAQQGRSQSWAPTSVRSVLFRPLYRGEIIYGQTQKRDSWGRTHQTDRPEADWIRRLSPALRIVTDAEWQAAHGRLRSARAMYFRSTKGQAHGRPRPALGNPSKYLLTNLALCGRCGGSLKVRTRSHGNGRKHFYSCAGFHERGRAVCTNSADVPMTDVDDIVIGALLDDILDPTMIADAIDEAVRLLQGDGQDDRRVHLEAELRVIEQERARLVTAIATGGDLGGLLDGLRARDRRQEGLQAELASLRAQAPLLASDTARVRAELMELADSWRQVLAADPQNARPIVTSLLLGRVTIVPTSKPKEWILKGEGTLCGLFSGTIRPLGMASPTGTETQGIPFHRTFQAA